MNAQVGAQAGLGATSLGDQQFALWLYSRLVALTLAAIPPPHPRGKHCRSCLQLLTPLPKSTHQGYPKQPAGMMRLQLWACAGWLQGEPTRVTSRMEIRPAAEMGPIICCLDTSGAASAGSIQLMCWPVLLPRDCLPPCWADSPAGQGSSTTLVLISSGAPQAADMQLGTPDIGAELECLTSCLDCGGMCWLAPVLAAHLPLCVPGKLCTRLSHLVQRLEQLPALCRVHGWCP